MYAVSITGEVIRVADGKIIKSHIRTTNSKQYAMVSLMQGDEYNAVSKAAYVHRLVALAWLAAPEQSKSMFVKHKDGNTLNNKAFNLEWADRVKIKRNRPTGIKHKPQTITKMRAAKKGANNPKYKGDYICKFKKYESATEAARWLKTTPKTIIKRCKGGKMKLEGWYFVPLERENKD